MYNPSLKKKLTVCMCNIIKVITYFSTLVCKSGQLTKASAIHIQIYSKFSPTEIMFWYSYKEILLALCNELYLYLNNDNVFPGTKRTSEF
jgi:hypothetical protein